MSPGRRLEVVAQGALSVPQMREVLGISSKTVKELLQSLLLKTADAEASAAEAVAAVDAKVAAEAAREASAAEAEAAVDAKAAAEAALAVAAAAAAAATVAVEEARAAATVAVGEARAAATVAVEEARAEASAAVAVAINAAGGDLGSPGTSELGTGSAAAIESMLRARLQGSGYSDAPVIANLVARLPTDQGIAYVQSLLRDPEESLPEETVAAALFQAFGMSAEAAVARGIAGLALAPSRPDAAAAAAGLLGLGVPASAEAASEDEARRAYQRQHLNLVSPLDSKFHDFCQPDDPAVALSGIQVIGKAQQWRALVLGDAGALVEAVEAAWGSGDHGSLSLAARTTLAAATVMSEFGDGLLAEILASTPSGQRGFAVWQASQAACGEFIVASADRAAVDNPLRTSQAVDLRAANKAGEASALGARMDGLVAVLSSSKRPATKEDGKLVAAHLGEAVTDWQSGVRPIQAVQQAVCLVRRSHLVMSQAGWVHNYTQLEDIQRIFLGKDIGRRSPSWL